MTEEEDDKNYDLEVTTDEKTWREIMAKDTSAAIAVLKKKIEVRPRLLKLANGKVKLVAGDFLWETHFH